MSKTLLCALAGLTLAALTFLPGQALAISHGCTTGDIKDITIDISLDGRKSQVAGPFCSAIEKAEAAIARSRLSAERKKAAYETLMQLQILAASQGTAAAGRKVSGSFGCKGNVSTGSSGTTATGGCGFQINF